MGIYWETLARWINTRARRDARRLGVPLVFLQAVDECNTIQGDPDAGWRLLNVPNMHKTGDIHGVLPAHVGMEVRFTAVQEELKAACLGVVRGTSLREAFCVCPPARGDHLGQAVAVDAKPRLGQLGACGSFSNSLLAPRACLAVLHGAEGKETRECIL